MIAPKINMAGMKSTRTASFTRCASSAGFSDPATVALHIAHWAQTGAEARSQAAAIITDLTTRWKFIG
jgi:hypothetical protein